MAIVELRMKYNELRDDLERVSHEVTRELIKNQLLKYGDLLAAWKDMK